MPANYRIPAHWHPTVERVTVLSGTMHMGVGDKLDMRKSMFVNVGDMHDHASSHTAFCVGQGEVLLQFHGKGPWGGIPCIDAADDPRQK